jgi:hypothetical protein
MTTKRRFFIPRSLKLLALGTLLAIGVLGARATGRQETSSCIRSWPELRQRSRGYDHIVHLSNDCRAKATCAVSSDVNPEPILVIVPAGERIEVVTSRGSPAAEFTPRVDCRFVT